MMMTPHEHLGFVEPALLPTRLTTGGAAVNGTRLVNPAQKAKYLVCALAFPSLAGVTAFAARLEGSNDNGATWAPVKQNDGVTDLAFTGADFLAGGKYSSRSASGTIDLTRGKYKDYRLGNVTEVGAATLDVSAIFFGFEPQNRPRAAMVDEWLNKFLPTGS